MSDLYAVANTCMPVECVCYRNVYVLQKNKCDTRICEECVTCVSALR